MFLASKPQGRLLEIGCGSGTALSYMESLGWQAEGVELDPAAVDNARRKGIKAQQGRLRNRVIPRIPLMQ